MCSGYFGMIDEVSPDVRQLDNTSNRQALSLICGRQTRSMRLTEINYFSSAFDDKGFEDDMKCPIQGLSY